MASTSMFGPSDLDTRPPGPYRDSMAAWVSCCHRCGYCAQDLTMGEPQLRRFLDEPAYRALLNDSQFPPLANYFRGCSYVEKRQNLVANAALSLLYAAWVCDDAEKDAEARQCRLEAVETMNAAIALGQSVGRGRDHETALQIDLLRRASRMDEAAEVIRMMRNTVTDPVVTRIIDYQSLLIEKGDTRAFTVAHAMNGSYVDQPAESLPEPAKKKRWWHFWKQ